MNTFKHDKRAELMVNDTALILKRFHYLMREFVLAEAGWMPGTTHWETKLLLPEFLWQDSQIFIGLRERVLELRYPKRRLEEKPDDKLIEAWRDLLRNAPSALAFSCALREAFKPYIRRSFELYMETSDALDDAPTMRILRQALDDISSQIARMHEAWIDALKVFPTAELEAASSWASEVATSLNCISSEDLLFPDLSTFLPAAWKASNGLPFRISRQGGRDSRFSFAKFPWPDSLDPSRGAGIGFELQVRQAQAHLNEVWAAEMACAVIFDFGENGPAEFLKDACRWCFDEIRHCRMGYQRFLHWGFEKGEMPMGSFSYDAGENLDPIVRLGIIFYFETKYINTKSERTVTFSELGDRVSSHDMDFDWADELIHTFYGKKWLTYFLEKSGEKRSLVDIKEAAECAVQDIRERATDADHLSTERLYNEVMNRARELSNASPIARP